MNTTTGAIQLVADRNGSSWGTAWSPDGEQLAFISDRALDDVAGGGETHGRIRRIFGSGVALGDGTSDLRASGPRCWAAGVVG